MTAYASWSVVFGEQPSAAKWNILGTNDASFNDGTGIGNGVIFPNHLKASASTNNNWNWDSWTPTLTNLTIGNGTLTCKYLQIGKTIFYDLYILFGTTSTTGGNISYSVPVTSISYSTNSCLGFGLINNTGTAQLNGAAAVYTSTTTNSLLVLGASATFTNYVNAGNTTPGAFGSGSYVSISGRYQAA